MRALTAGTLPRLLRHSSFGTVFPVNVQAREIGQSLQRNESMIICKPSLAASKNSIYTALTPLLVIFLLIAFAPAVCFAGQATGSTHQKGERRKIADVKKYGPAVSQELDGAIWRT